MHRNTLLGLFLLPAFAFAQANATVPDPDPELERKSFIVAPGFEVTLFAADPLLAKPLQINFDPQGRLWVASSEVYPQIKPGQKANDKIVILEDTKGVGKADKVTVFAEGLLIPTGIEPGDGGAYVANSTELVHLSASKPGGKADKTRVVLSGFGTEDTHHILHTFRWGPDGCLYMNQSIYIHSHIETPHGVKRLNAGGIWRFRPESMDLDVFVRGFVNTWGHHFDRWGQSLITDGAYGEGVNHGVPGAYFFTAVGATRIMKGLNPGSPKHCGLEVVSGRHLPDDWQGNVITNDFRGHRVCRFKISDEGSSFTSREQVEVIKTNHPAFRPIDVKMGPDGAIYIADWYNPIIQHGEVDFRDPRRDHTHGRIWRVTAKGRPLVPKPNLVGATTPELLDHLKAPEDWTRLNAKRVLKERGAKEVLPALAEWVKRLDRRDADFDHQLLEALWVYQGFDVVEPELLLRVLGAKDHRARAAATRVLSHWHPRVPNAVEYMAARAIDESPRVRMEAVRALAATGKAEAVAPAFAALDKPVDSTMDYALWLTARDLAPVWMPKLQAGEDVFRGNVKALAFALEAMGSREVARPLRALIDGKKLPKDRESAAWTLLARFGGPEDLRHVLVEGVKAIDSDAHRNSILKAVEENARQNRIVLKEQKSEFDTLFDLAPSSSIEAARSAIRLIGLWKVDRLHGLLVNGAQSEKATPASRANYLEALVLFGNAKSGAVVADLCGPNQPGEVRRLAVAALAQIDPAAAARQATELLSTAKPDDDLSAVFAAFLAQKSGGAVLARALEGKKLHADVARAGLKAVRSAAQDAKALTEALTKAGNVAFARTDYSPEEIRAYVSEVLTKGDPVRGEQVYRRKEATCLACHAIAGAGGLVGPDLTSIGASAQVDYLVESILNPNKAVKEGYHALKIITLDGKVHVGVKTREAEGKLYLRNAEDKEVAVAEKDIDEKAQSRSLMPDGLADQLTRQEFVDLVRFLSELGKVGPYAPNKARLLRRWQVLDASPTNIHQIQRARAAAAVDTPDTFAWSAAYSKASGELPLDALPRLVVWTGAEPFGMARGMLDVTTGGKVLLKINGAAGLTLWVDNTPVEVKDETILDLKPGLHPLTFSIDLNKRTTPLRVELEDVPGSAGRANLLGGK